MLNKVIKLVERRAGTYAAVKYDATTCAIVAEWCKINNIPNPIDVEKMHSTVIYSRAQIGLDVQQNLASVGLVNHLKVNNKVIYPAPGAYPATGWRFTTGEFKLMPTSSEKGAKKEVLVLTLNAPELVKLHDELCRRGATHDFDDFIPHVTLSYKVRLDFDMSLVPPPVYFIPSQIYFEPLDLNWSEKK